MLMVVAFSLGASVGSLLNLAADRLPQSISMLRPRSFCDSCGHALAILDLIPIISYLWLRGHCRHCSSRIPVRVILVEAINGVLFTISYLRNGLGIEFLAIGVIVSLMLVVAIIDLEHKLILNRVIYPAILVLIFLAPFWTGLGFPRPFLGSAGMLASMANTLVAGVGAYFVFFVIALLFPRGMGGGDVKLAGTVGLLVGFPGVVVSLWIAVVFSGLSAIGLLLTGRKRRKDTIPFGPFMATAVILTVLAGGEIIGRYQTFVAGLASE